jgi:hypothetical protein
MKHLYSVTYQHYTNAIEMFLILQKKTGLTYNELNEIYKKGHI